MRICATSSTDDVRVLRDDVYVCVFVRLAAQMKCADVVLVNEAIFVLCGDVYMYAYLCN